MNAKNNPNLNQDGRYFYVYLTEKLVEGDVSKHTPQHITLIPPFEADRQAVLNVAKAVALKYSPFEVKTNGHTTFGPKKDIHVILIKPNKLLQSMHISLLNKLKDKNIIINYQHFICDEFAPHITIKSFHPKIDADKVLVIDHVAVMYKLKATKTVLAIYRLGK